MAAESAPVPQSIDRSCVVMSTFGQSLMVFGNDSSSKSYIVDAAGMIKDFATWNNCVAICCGLECLGTKPYIKYGYDSEAYTMKQTAGGLCAKKRYHMIKDGARGFRDGTKLAETFKPKGKCGAPPAFFKIRVPSQEKEGVEVDKYYVNTKAQCCKGEGTMGNCTNGFLKFLPIMKTTLPIMNAEKVEVGRIAVIQPLMPVGPVCAAGGCTLSSKIEMNDTANIDDDEKARLALLLLSINNHQAMGYGFSGCPACVFGLGFKVLGWPFSVQYAGGSKEYLPLDAAFTEGIAESGDLVDRMKAKFNQA